MSCAAAAGGCKKSSTDTGSAPEQSSESVAVVTLNSADMTNDSTISPAGMKKIEKEAASPTLHVIFSRTRVSDAGLLQLAKFRNLRRVKSAGGGITPEGIDKLKAKIPEVEVTK